MKGIDEKVCHVEFLRSKTFENYILKKIDDILELSRFHSTQQNGAQITREFEHYLGVFHFFHDVIDVLPS